jgi:glutamate N-acetyltransferase/amino-acid N-acetyltransferase
MAASKVTRFTLTKASQPTLPAGYLAQGVHCGIKKNNALDLALIVSSSQWPTAAAATFTRNAFQAAPVQVSKAVLANSPHAKALITNSGCANAVTGSKGLENAWAMSRAVDEALKARGSDSNAGTLVMSTGVIGQHLPMRRILPAIKSSLLPTLSSSFESWDAAARAFMTTDTFPKLRTRRFTIPGRSVPVHFVGIDKGAGMMHPNMGPPHATLLGMVATDATVDPAALQSALTYATNRSFNSISVDGDTSTNDTVVALANGAAWRGEAAITEQDEGYEAFRDELTSFMVELAQLIVWDGEGATKFVTINVEVSFQMALRDSQVWS